MQELCNISAYLRKIKQPLMQEVNAFGLIPDIDTKAEFVSRKHMERIDNYHSKPLHGYYPQVCEDLTDPKLNFLLLLNGFLTGETEGLLIVAQDLTCQS